MSAVDNHRIRIMIDNLIHADISSFTYSSQKTGFTASNTMNAARSKVWKPTGHFLIDSSNDTIYINDGSNKTVTITRAAYTTASSLATVIQTALNASSSNWTVTYNSSTFTFLIVNTGSVTLRLTQTSAAIWETLGYTGSSDLTGTSFSPNEQRNHTNEYLKYDFGYNATVDFLGIIAPLAIQFPISSTATVSLQGNNIDDWTTPPFDEEMTITERGIFGFFDHVTDRDYRFWRINIVDQMNAEGPEGIQIGHVYLGPQDTFTTRNVGNAFEIMNFDPSELSESRAGVLYSDIKTKYRIMNSMPWNYLDQTAKEILEEIFEQVGISTSFYVSVDPQQIVSSNLEDLTMYGNFVESPTYQHRIKGLWDTTLRFREVV